MTSRARGAGGEEPSDEFNMDLHISQDDSQFSHLGRHAVIDDTNEERKFTPVSQAAGVAIASDDTSSAEEGESEDSDAGPTRWKEPNSLEMDCIFLEEEGAKDDSALPQIFDLDSIVPLESRFCMLCSETYGHFRMLQKKNCRRCGKSVCESCSKAQRKLSLIDQKKHRICDECDASMANHLLLKMFEREVENKKNSYEEKRAQLTDMKIQRDETLEQLDRAKQLWEQKTSETDKKIQIREKQLKTKADAGKILKSEIEELQKMLEEVSEKVNDQQVKRQTILGEINHMQQEQKRMGSKLQMQASLIDEKNRLLLKEKDTAVYNQSLVGDDVQEVDYVDRQNWRQRVSSSDGSGDSNPDESGTESQPAQSYEQKSPLQGRGGR